MYFQLSDSGLSSAAKNVFLVFYSRLFFAFSVFFVFFKEKSSRAWIHSVFLLHLRAFRAEIRRSRNAPPLQPRIIRDILFFQATHIFHSPGPDSASFLVFFLFFFNFPPPTLQSSRAANQADCQQMLQAFHAVIRKDVDENFTQHLL